MPWRFPQTGAYLSGIFLSSGDHGSQAANRLRHRPPRNGQRPADHAKAAGGADVFAEVALLELLDLQIALGFRGSLSLRQWALSCLLTRRGLRTDSQVARAVVPSTESNLCVIADHLRVLQETLDGELLEPPADVADTLACSVWSRSAASVCVSSSSSIALHRLTGDVKAIDRRACRRAGGRRLPSLSVKPRNPIAREAKCFESGFPLHSRLLTEVLPSVPALAVTPDRRPPQGQAFSTRTTIFEPGK